MRLFHLVIVALLWSASARGQATHPTKASHSPKKPIEIIQGIFKEYTEYEDGLDSDENKESMRRAVQSLSGTVPEKDLIVLLDVWMYYQPTDFPTGSLIDPVFERNRTASIAAIEYRMTHKRKWETDESLRDLYSLKERLEK